MHAPVAQGTQVTQGAAWSAESVCRRLSRDGDGRDARPAQN